VTTTTPLQILLYLSMFIVQMVKKKSIKLLNSDFEDMANKDIEEMVLPDNSSKYFEDMANKDIEEMVLPDNSSKYIIKDYLEVSLDTKVEVLEVIDDDEIKYEVKECGKELQVDFIRTKSIILNMNFSVACTHHILKFEVHESKTCYFVNLLATMLYSKYLFLGSGRVQFLTDNSGARFLEV